MCCACRPHRPRSQSCCVQRSSSSWMQSTAASSKDVKWIQVPVCICKWSAHSDKQRLRLLSHNLLIWLNSTQDQKSITPTLHQVLASQLMTTQLWAWSVRVLWSYVMLLSYPFWCNICWISCLVLEKHWARKETLLHDLLLIQHIGQTRTQDCVINYLLIANCFLMAMIHPEVHVWWICNNMLDAVVFF